VKVASVVLCLRFVLFGLGVMSSVDRFRQNAMMSLAVSDQSAFPYLVCQAKESAACHARKDKVVWLVKSENFNLLIEVLKCFPAD